VFPDLQGSIPSTATITRAQRLIEGEVLGEVMKDVMARQYNFVRVSRKIYAAEVLSQRDVLACDGQAMRATARLRPDGSRSSGKQITSIVSYETGMTLGQVIHDKKNQEKKAIIELAEDMDIYALFCINRTSRSRRFSEADDAVLILTNSCCTVGRAVSEHQIFSMPSVLCNPLPSDWGKYQLIP
jgi:hypothetical protein